MKKSLVAFLLAFPFATYAGPISGTLTINSNGTGNYTTIQAAINDIAAQGVSGAVTIKLAEGTYNEEIVIPEITSLSAKNTLTIEPVDDDVVITHQIEADYKPSTEAERKGVITFNGADYVTLKDLTIKPLLNGSVFYTAAIYVGGGSQNITIEDCSILFEEDAYTNKVATNNGIRIFTAKEGTPSSGLTVKDCDFYLGSVGIYSATATTDIREEITVIDNEFAYQGLYGIGFAGDMSGSLIKENEFVAQWPSYSGIKGAASTATNKPTMIEANKFIMDIYGGFKAIDIAYKYVGNADAPLRVINNEIYGNTGSDGSTSANGIYASSASSTYVEIANNTIYLEGTKLGYGIYLSSTALPENANWTIANNIIQKKLTNGGNDKPAVMNLGNTANLTTSGAMKFTTNCFYTNVASAGLYYAKTGSSSATNMTTADWEDFCEDNGITDSNLYQEITFEDSEYYNENDSDYDIELKPKKDQWIFLTKGTPLDYVTTDIDGVTRSATTPTIGCYETTTATAVESIKASTVKNHSAKYFDISGKRTNGLRKGLNIVRSDDGTVKKILK